MTDGQSVSSSVPIEALATAFAEHGLALRGGFAFDPDENAPDGPSGAPARALILVGNVGAAMWPHFVHWRDGPGRVAGEPLDTWTKAVVDPIAVAANARPLYPSDRPWQPFQRWAMRAEGLKPSPLGLLMHPIYGLWHAYRAALLFDIDVPVPVVRNPIHRCDACIEKHCLTICPVSAFSAEGYDVESCAKHVRGGNGEACRTDGCRARNACPIGARHRYGAAQQAFHMAAFLTARG